MRFKIDLAERINGECPVILELGCGRMKTDGRIGIDKLDLPNVDIVTDVEDGLPFLPDNSVDEIHSDSFFEHVNDLESLLREIVRVLKPNGTCHVFVPHFSNPYYYSDYTHSKFMGLYTFYYFVNEEHQLKRKVPNFYSDVRIKILYQRHVIANPFKRRAYLKKLCEHIFNINKSFQEFYEENLCWILPSYGLKIVFSPEKNVDKLS